MYRRTFIKHVASASLLALSGAGLARASAGRQIAVIGAGIVGASIAYHLALRGAKVTVLEKDVPAAGATRNSFAWINSFSKLPRQYHDLSVLGIAGWNRLQQQLGGELPIQWGGSVHWRDKSFDGDRLRRDVARLQSWDYAARLIEESELQLLLPGLVSGPVSAAAFTKLEGAVNPTIVTQLLLEQAKRHGAKFEYPVEARILVSKGDRVVAVQTSQGNIQVDDVVIAAGLGSTALARLVDADVPLDSSPGVRVHTSRQPELLGRVVSSSAFNANQTPDGRVVIGSRAIPEPATPTREYGQAVIDNAAGFLPGLKSASLEDVTLGQRVLPKDGFPVVGHLPTRSNVYFAATHSGVTLAPLIGQLAVLEILDGGKADVLGPYRPGRFG